MFKMLNYEEGTAAEIHIRSGVSFLLTGWIALTNVFFYFFFFLTIASHQRWLQLQGQHLSQQEEGGVKEKGIWVPCPNSTPAGIFRVTQRSNTGSNVKHEWSLVWVVVSVSRTFLLHLPLDNSEVGYMLQTFSCLQATYPGCPRGGACPWLPQGAGGEGTSSCTWQDKREGTKRLVFLETRFVFNVSLQFFCIKFVPMNWSDRLILQSTPHPHPLHHLQRGPDWIRSQQLTLMLMTLSLM